MKLKENMQTCNQIKDWLIKQEFVKPNQVLIDPVPDHQGVYFQIVGPLDVYHGGVYISNNDSEWNNDTNNISLKDLTLKLLADYFNFLANDLNNVNNAFNEDMNIMFPIKTQTSYTHINDKDLIRNYVHDMFWAIQLYIEISQRFSKFKERCDKLTDGTPMKTIMQVLNDYAYHYQDDPQIMAKIKKAINTFNQYGEFFALLYGLFLPVIDQHNNASLFDILDAIDTVKA